MEYLIASDLPFDEIEAQIVEALERQGWMVQRTFSLRSVVGADRRDRGTLTLPDHSGATGAKPGYSVLMLYAAGALRRPLGLITLYERGDRTVVKPVLAPARSQEPSSADAQEASAPAGSDAHAVLVAALVRGGLRFSIDVANGEFSRRPDPV